jgi:AAA+ superfamily predicted ATPase
MRQDLQDETPVAVAHVEIAIDPAAAAAPLIPLPQLSLQWQRFFETRPHLSTDPSAAPPALRATCASMSIHIDDDDKDVLSVSTNDCRVVVHTFILSTEPVQMEELEPTAGDDEWTAACENLALPHASLQGQWESLVFEGPVKANLLQFAKSALLFADLAVSGSLVHWNRLLLFHGPPGTGKTSLCRALAQKLSIRMSARFPRAALLEIHSHSLFSKWFSTSGKLISRLFQLVADMVQDDPDCLICVLMDEIESLAGSRAGLSASGEPSDALRAVNSLLTSLDRLRGFPNVLIFANTNLTASVDVAFLDRADMKVYIGLPCHQARHEILQSCLVELVRVGIIIGAVPKQGGGNNDQESFRLRPFHQASLEPTESCSGVLYLLAKKAEGMSGRSLRRLPLQTHALFVRRENSVSMNDFLVALGKAIANEITSTQQVNSSKA